MRKCIVALAMLIILKSTNAQKLEVNKVDEFTKLSVKKTSYEVAVQNFKMNLFFRVSKVEGDETVDMKFILGAGKVISIRDNMQLMFMLDNDSVISLLPLESVVACKGCGARGYAGSGAYGIEVKYILYPEIHSILKQHPIKKIRIYTDDGYVETELKEKRSNLLQELLPLVE